MTGKRSKKVKFDPYIIKQLFEEAAKKDEKTCESSDSKELSISISELVKGRDPKEYAPIGPLYIYNGYNFCIDAIQDKEEIGFSEAHLNSIALHLDFKNIYDYITYYKSEGKSPKPILSQLQIKPSKQSFTISTYFIQARLLPGIIIYASLFTLYDQVSKTIINQPAGVGWVGIPLLLAGIVGGGQLSSVTSKIFQKQLFHKKKGFPSSYFMLYDHPRYPDDVKDRFRIKVHQLFKLKLCNKSEELTQPEEAIQRMKAATEEIVSIVKSKKLFAANVRYGLIRNTLGAALISLVFTTAGFVISYIHGDPITQLSFGTSLIIAVLLLLFWKPLLKNTAESYAQQLLFEFLNKVY